MDREQIVQRAIRKLQARQELTATERKSYERWNTEQNEKRGLAFVAELPKKFWKEWSGRQHKILNEQAELYGIPIGGATIDVAAVARWLHDFLSQHKHVLPELVAGEDPAGEPKSLKGKLEAEKVQQLRHRNQLLEDQLATNRQQLIPRADLHIWMTEAALLLRGAGERLERRFGAEAAEILNDTLDSFEQKVSQLAVADGSDQS